jgi:hypothetical protein
MRFFLKSIGCWKIVETGCTNTEETTLELVSEKKTHDLLKIKPSMLYALSLFEFTKISNGETALEDSKS